MSKGEIIYELKSKKRGIIINGNKVTSNFIKKKHNCAHLLGKYWKSKL